MTDEPPFWTISAVGRGRAADTESKQYQILVPSTLIAVTFRALESWDGLAKKNLQVETTPVFSQLNAPSRSSNSAHQKNGKKRRTRAPLQSREKFLVGQLWSPQTPACWVTFLWVIFGFDPLGVGYRVKRPLWPYTYVCKEITWEDNFRKTTRWKKRPYKSHTHISPFNQKIWLFQEMWHVIVISPAKMPPPFQMPRIPGVFPWVVATVRVTTATPLPWPHLGNPGSLEGFIGCWKVVYLTFPTVAARNAPGNQSGYPLVESLLQTRQPQKTMTYRLIYTLSLFFVGREGGHRKKKRDKPNKRSHRFLPPSSGRHGFRFLSNIAKCSTSFLRMRRISRRVGRLFM